MTPTSPPPPHDADLDVLVVSDPGDLDAVRAEWDELVLESGSDIYFKVDWIQAWWAHYGRGRRFVGLLVRDGAGPVACLPFSVGRVWAGPVPVTLARFAGADSTLPVFQPAIVGGHESRVLSRCVSHLIDEEGVSVISLAPLAGDSAVPGAIDDALAGTGGEVVRRDSTGPHTVFRLPDTFEDYLASLSKSQRQNHRRYLRKLEKEHGLTARVLTGDDAIDTFDRFVTLHARHWEAAGKAGHFGDWPDSEEFNRELVARLAPAGEARFVEFADRDGQVLSLEYCFVLGDRCYWRLPARDPDPELEKMRLGRVSLAEMFHACMDQGQRMVEGGPGHYEYKLRLGAEELELQRVVVARRSLTAGLRARLLLRWADLVHLVYYRGWFLKIAPRLGLRPRSLWRVWIRSRL